MRSKINSADVGVTSVLSIADIPLSPLACLLCADSVATLPKCRATNFRGKTKQATIAEQCSLKPATGIACEFGARRVVPHIIIRSSRLRLGEFGVPVANPI